MLFRKPYSGLSTRYINTFYSLKGFPFHNGEGIGCCLQTTRPIPPREPGKPSRLTGAPVTHHCCTSALSRIAWEDTRYHGRAMTLSVHADGPFESRGAGQDRKRSTSFEAYAESPGIVPLFERGSYVTLSCFAHP